LKIKPSSKDPLSDNFKDSFISGLIYVMMDEEATSEKKEKV
jgi:hypothetical protein